MTYFAIYIAIAILVVAGFSRCAELDRADERRERTERIIATVRQQQRAPRVIERNLRVISERHIQRSRWPQLERIYAEIERAS